MVFCNRRNSTLTPLAYRIELALFDLEILLLFFYTGRVFTHFLLSLLVLTHHNLTTKTNYIFTLYNNLVRYATVVTKIVYNNMRVINIVIVVAATIYFTIASRT